LKNHEQAAQSVLLHSVSSPRESLILVDADDREVGYDSKEALHTGNGKRHRAFSVFLFDQDNRLLLHQRSQLKPLWPGFWTNSCCSHPRRGESLREAVRRRVREELGINPQQVTHSYRFEYHARFGERGSEHELCHVFLARLGAGEVLRVHPEEVAGTRWLGIAAVDSLLKDAPDDLTPWFKLEWQQLRGRRRAQLSSYLAQPLDPRSVA
jgi:isopentenyl-diphosphate delta-isomerase